MRPAGIRVLVAFGLLTSGLTGCSDAPEVTPTPSPEALDPWTSLIATATGDAVDVFAAAGADVSEQTLSAVQASSLPDRTPLTFLVVGQADGWLEVLLPVAPAGSTGWVRQGDVTVSTTDLRLEVRLGDHRLLLHRADDVVLDVAIALGSDPVPGPGRYFVTELLQPPGSVAGSGSVYGTFVYGLSGYPPLLASFTAGEGLTGIHGTGDPAGLGADGAPGSVRLLDADVARLVQEFGLPLGTPVDVVA